MYLCTDQNRGKETNIHKACSPLYFWYCKNKFLSSMLNKSRCWFKVGITFLLTVCIKQTLLKLRERNLLSFCYGRGRRHNMNLLGTFYFQKKLSFIYINISFSQKILQLYSCLLHYLHRKWPQYKNNREKEEKQQPIYAFPVSMFPRINILKPLTKYLHHLSSMYTFLRETFLTNKTIIYQVMKIF